MAMRDSRARTALAVMVLVLAALRFESLVWILPVMGLVFVLIGAEELRRLSVAKGIEFSRPVAYACGASVFLAGLVPPFVFPWIVLSLFATIIVIAFAVHLSKFSYEGTIAGVGTFFLVPFYFAFPLACGLQVLQADRMFFIFVLACVWAMDSAAYYFGCAYGRHRLAPRVSPKKSWEGAAAAFVGSVAAGLVARAVLPLSLNWLEVLGLSAAFGIIGQVGDLAESALKRDAGVKDSGSSFAGHGGVLDRLDSLLFCFLCFYVYLVMRSDFPTGCVSSTFFDAVVGAL
jgi:phosphatidate cytidylyltransferase